MTTKDEYDLGVRGAVGILKVLGKNPIYRKDISDIWNYAGQVAKNLATIPGSSMSNAMAAVAEDLGGVFTDDGKDAGGKSINPRIEF